MAHTIRAVTQVYGAKTSFTLNGARLKKKIWDTENTENTE
jgi:hypothetical protein